MVTTESCGEPPTAVPHGRRVTAESELLGFRRIEVLGHGRVVLLARGGIDDPQGEEPSRAARIFVSADNGETWRETFVNTDAEAFYDCLDMFADGRTVSRSATRLTAGSASSLPPTAGGRGTCGPRRHAGRGGRRVRNREWTLPPDVR